MGGGLVWAGIGLALLSSVPIHPALYAILVLAGAAWVFARNRSAHRERSFRRALIVVVVLVSMIALADRWPSRPALASDKPVYVIGDSLSAGLGTPAEATWPRLLSEKLKLTVVNLASAGASLADGLAQARAIPHGSAIVVIALGGNDLLRGVSSSRFSADLQALLAEVSAKDRRVAMFELPLLPFQNAFGRIQRQACKRHGVTLLPRAILAGAVALPGHAVDGLHLSAQGHSWLAERVRRIWHAG
jgi:acyl-CoA thioesterase-1